MIRKICKTPWNSLRLAAVWGTIKNSFVDALKFGRLNAMIRRTTFLQAAAAIYRNQTLWFRSQIIWLRNYSVSFLGANECTLGLFARIQVRRSKSVLDCSLETCNEHVPINRLNNSKEFEVPWLTNWLRILSELSRRKQWTFQIQINRRI